MLHVVKQLDRRFGAGDGTVVRALAVLSVVTLAVGALLLAWR